ncbi:hypothetical protein BIV25_03520 [Streptomyces sp. MUSC 14]|nr:hypothetical protein BIV25_03520 [Streptomyces sp. MUSC 14]
MRVFVSGGYIGQFEQAIRKPQLDVPQRIDDVLQTDGFFERLCRKVIGRFGRGSERFSLRRRAVGQAAGDPWLPIAAR